MSFYRRIEDRIETAEQSVFGPGFDLRAEDHAQHRYPVHGWYWFDTLDEAMDGLPRFGKPEPTNIEEWRQHANDIRSTERIRRQTGGFSFSGHIYRSDREESIPLMVSAAIHAQVALAMGEEATALYNAALGNGWRDQDGVACLTTAQEILGLHGAFVAWGAANDRASQMIAADIDIAESIDALELITTAIPTDARWPS